MGKPNSFQKYDKDNLPMDGALCVFRSNHLFLMGYIKVEDGDHVIKQFGKNMVYDVAAFAQFHYLLNEENSFIYVDAKA